MEKYRTISTYLVENEDGEESENDEEDDSDWDEDSDSNESEQVEDILLSTVKAWKIVWIEIIT